MQIEHLRSVLTCMRKNRLFANIKKCLVEVEYISFLGCFSGKDGISGDPEKIRAIAQRPTPNLRKNYASKWNCKLLAQVQRELR